MHKRRGISVATRLRHFCDTLRHFAQGTDLPSGLKVVSVIIIIISLSSFNYSLSIPPPGSLSFHPYCFFTCIYSIITTYTTTGVTA